MQIYEPKIDDPPVPPDLPEDEEIRNGDLETGTGAKLPGGDENPLTEPRTRRYVVDNVEFKVAAERVQYFGADGKLMTVSLKDYTRQTVTKEFASLDDFLQRWSSADKKQAIVDELAHEGVFFEALSDEIGKDCDPFDLVCHVAWDMPPLTRRERSQNVKKRNYFANYGEQARRVLEALLDKYADRGIGQIESRQILTVVPFTQFGTPMEIVRAFGGLEGYEAALRDLKQSLYSA